jgi:hypothetical protein
VASFVNQSSPFVIVPLARWRDTDAYRITGLWRFARYGRPVDDLWVGVVSF